jgi:hypothetical protein
MDAQPQTNGTAEKKEHPLPRAVAAKIAKIMGDLTRIPKRGHNAAQNYSYATESDVADALRASMAAHNFVCLPSFGKPDIRTITTKSGAHLSIATVLGVFTFIDADSGETWVSHFPGEGMDSGDKAVYKAMTGAEKYCLLKTFKLSTGDDPEKAGAADEPGSRTDQVKARMRSAKPTPEEKKAATALVEQAAKDLDGEIGSYLMPFASKEGRWDKGAPIESLETQDIQGLAKWKGARDDLKDACRAELERRGEG